MFEAMVIDWLLEASISAVARQLRGVVGRGRRHQGAPSCAVSHAAP
jgi:hypothetical protein